MPPIRSASNPLVKRLRDLAGDAATRRSEGLFMLEGPKLAREALLSGLVRELVADELAWAQGMEELRSLATKHKVKVTLASERVFEAVSDAESPQGVLALAQIPPAATPKTLSGLALALDGIQDPGNLGTLLRGALAAGCDFVLLNGECADAYSPKAVRAGAGAQLKLGVRRETSMLEALRQLVASGAKVVAALPRASVVYTDVAYDVPTCFLVGSEGKGLRPDLVASATDQVALKYPGPVESLNAAACGQLLLFEALRQRRKTL